MLSVLLKKTPGDIYRKDVLSKTALDELTNFLEEDALLDAWFCEDLFDPETSFFMEWLQDVDPENDWIGGNNTELIKRGDQISVAFQYRKNKGDWSNAFTTSRENMIEILRRWYEHVLIQPLPEEILVVQEGEKIFFTSKFVSKNRTNEIEPQAAV